jgi:hypothetical protein
MRRTLALPPHEALHADEPKKPSDAIAESANERDSPLDEFTARSEIQTEDQLSSFLTAPRPSKVIFRGQPDRFPKLQPSIERFGRNASSLFAKEDYIGREFMRRAPNYLRALPKQEDALAWLALARHHGAPSRLLDWSRSLPVAAFFAASGANENEGCIVWEIDEILLKRYALKILRERFKEPKSSWEDLISRGQNFEHAFLEMKPSAFFVAPLEPFEASERMTIQQGLFLASSSLAFPFERILATTLQDAEAPTDSIHRIRICPEARLHLLYLLEKMNITETTLFPGIDGFARSLRITVELAGKVRDGMSRIMLGETQPRPWRR